MSKFAKYEPVTIIDVCSPFYMWAGTVEHVGLPGCGDERREYFVVECTASGPGLGAKLRLVFHSTQLQAGLPKEEVADVRC